MARAKTKNGEYLPKCQCGALMPSRRFRDFYSHVVECHPGGEVAGIPCQTCQQLIPFGLGPCHHYMEHDVRPPFGPDFADQMQQDFIVLQKVTATLAIVEADE